MNREIKFRAWEPEYKCMYFNHSVNFGVDGRVFFLERNAQWNEIKEGQLILMQFTGLKDKVGKEIFEGDIVSTGDKTMSVSFDGGCYRTKYNQSNYRLYGWKDEILEVVGNIYEHPELLKEKTF